MAKLVDVFRSDKQTTLSRRQLPLNIDDNLTMIMDLSSMGIVCDTPWIRGKELEEFNTKYSILPFPELKTAFEVEYKDLLVILSQTIPCVGCRRSVERLFYQLVQSGHPALDPLVLNEKGILTLKDEFLSVPQFICTLVHGHSSRLYKLVDSQPRNKKSRRCNLHTLDTQRSRSVAVGWRDVWDCMQQACREEVVLIDAATLHTTLEAYLRKHRFCAECRTKVLKAYSLLVEEPEPSREKGYVAALYSGIRRCLQQKHIHLKSKTDYIANLIVRAEPELMGSRRERHAKTLEIAQEEVLTCLGLCVYERLHRIYLRLKEEECTCQVLAAVAVEALCRSFEMAVERKQGISQLELLFEQFNKEDQAKQLRKEHKKQKRRRKKEKRAEQEEKENNCECHSEENSLNLEEPRSVTCNTCSELKININEKVPDLDRKSKVKPICYCEDCRRKKNDNNEDNNKLTKNPKQISKISSNRPPLPSCSPPGSLSPCQSCQSAQGLASGSMKSSEIPSRANEGWSSSEHSQDNGYSSENNNGSSLISSPEGSEIACSDGWCNHEGDCPSNENPSNFTHSNPPVGGLRLTLQEMLENSCSSEDECSESLISAEEVLEFQSRVGQLAEQRQQLRQTLKFRFDQLCQATITLPSLTSQN